MKVFLPQTTLEEWALADKADVKDGKLQLAESKQSVAVTPAVHFAKLVSGPDEKKLLGRVKTHQQLESLGAEHLADSVVLGETAYEVVEGYVAELALPATSSRPAIAKQGPATEADLLAEFLLGKL